MPLKKSRKRDLEEDEDNHESEEELTIKPKSKKSKKASADVELGEREQDDKGDPFWTLSSGRNQRRVGISEYRKARLINLREYYEKDGEMKPGAKGISLTLEQYQVLLKVIPEINEELKKSGEDVDTSSAKAKDEGEEGAASSLAKKAKSKSKKPNFEATSDEDE